VVAVDLCDAFEPCSVCRTALSQNPRHLWQTDLGHTGQAASYICLVITCLIGHPIPANGSKLHAIGQQKLSGREARCTSDAGLENGLYSLSRGGGNLHTFWVGLEVTGGLRNDAPVHQCARRALQCDTPLLQVLIRNDRKSTIDFSHDTVMTVMTERVGTGIG
jgi:hypothetical protein